MLDGNAKLDVGGARLRIASVHLYLFQFNVGTRPIGLTLRHAHFHLIQAPAALSRIDRKIQAQQSLVRINWVVAAPA